METEWRQNGYNMQPLVLCVNRAEVKDVRMRAKRVARIQGSTMRREIALAWRI
jgi:hypothetical protein